MEKISRVLITGATGNVGMAVLNSLKDISHRLQVYAGVRDPEADNQKLATYNVTCIPFDFTNMATFQPACANCDILFLLRPPQLSDVKKYFKPLLQIAAQCSIKHIVFLSVQGVEKSSIIPHHKIEKLIVESKIPYTFLRPAYFMQNFSSTLRHDLVKKRLIFLPAGKAKFTLVDVRDIGAVGAIILNNISHHVNAAYELTSKDKLSFKAMAEKLSHGLECTIDYQSPGLLKFYQVKRKEHMPVGLILVMIMLHYLPRFQQEPAVTHWIEKITGKPPISFEQFISDNREQLR